MSEQILLALKRKISDLAAYGAMDAEKMRNGLKEELQFYVLNFIYHHPKYGRWIMYGGSALRVIHGLDRMSVDLDFEITDKITENFLNELKREVEKYFAGDFGAKSDFLSIKIAAGRGLLLKFQAGEALNIGHPSKQVHVKIDLNYFIAPKTIVTERWPVNRGQLSFVIVTYNMSALMASKIAAIFQRGARGIGKAMYEEKGRDIYDLLWYMDKKITPDFDYLAAKNVKEAKDLRTLFDRLTIKMNKVSDDNLKQDLLPLFLDQSYIENWLKNWRESYFRLFDKYNLNIITTLENIKIRRHFESASCSFTYAYNTESGKLVSIRYIIDDHWIIFRDVDLPIEINKKLEDKIDFVVDERTSTLASQDKLKRYATLFYRKTEAYFKKTNRIMLGDAIITKVIKMMANNLNQQEHIVLNKSALLASELDDLLK